LCSLLASDGAIDGGWPIAATARRNALASRCGSGGKQADALLVQRQLLGRFGDLRFHGWFFLFVVGLMIVYNSFSVMFNRAVDTSIIRDQLALRMG
jgi:hypothetical protein